MLRTAGDDRTSLMRNAALDRSPRAVAGWRGVRAAGGLDALDPNDQWLAPAAYWNLRSLGVPESDLVRLRATYRYHWFRNGLALRECVRTLDGIGPRGVIVGSAAVALNVGADHGAYPIGELAVIVAPRAAVIGKARWCGRDIAVLGPADLLAQIFARSTDWDPRSPWLWLVAAVGVIRAHADLDWSRIRALASAQGGEQGFDFALHALRPFVSTAG